MTRNYGQTSNSRPNRYVTVAAPMPIPSCRIARLKGEAPESRPTIPPVTSSAMDTEPRAQASAVIPVAPKKNGIIGMMAPEAKNKNDAMATFHGLPTDSYSSALSSSAGPCDPSGRAEKLGSQSQVRYPKR